MFLRYLAFLAAAALNLGLLANNQASNVSRPRLTIWVHGTTIRAVVPIKTSYFHLDSKLMSFKKLRPESLAYKRALALKQADEEAFPLKSFYLFRWSGMLSFKERQNASQQLYTELKQKIAKIKQKTGQDPIITIVAHSHGGNIALTLASLNEKSSSNLLINNLILLACPVQNSTAHWINDEIFEKVFVFYSKGDWIQRLALHQGINLAGRKFDNVAGLKDKVVHISTSWKRKYLWHNDFKTVSFVSCLPKALRDISKQIISNHYNAAEDILLAI